MPQLTGRLTAHPCFSLAAHGKTGRIHLPVAPRCSIQCAFCDRRFDCANEARPGVTSAVITPAEAVQRVEDALRREPRIRVAGIAGPGDPMANPETFETLRLLRAAFPDLILCTSTNGLLLEEGLEHLLAARLDTITITINAANAETAGQIYTSIWWKKELLPVQEGVLLLLEKQRQALRLCRQSGIAVKVNTVLIPGVNDGDIAEIARLAASEAAAVMNVMPLIPCGKMAARPAPTAEQLTRARTAAGLWMDQFVHCQHCRADACGVL